ncbi:MAG: hypothetical protein ACRYGI_02620 [Janthinobacterium lividum]
MTFAHCASASSPQSAGASSVSAGTSGHLPPFRWRVEKRLAPAVSRVLELAGQAADR